MTQSVQEQAVYCTWRRSSKAYVITIRTFEQTAKIPQPAVNSFEAIENKGKSTCISAALLCHHPPTLGHNMSSLKALEWIYFCLIIIVYLCHATYSSYWKDQMGAEDGGSH